MGVWKRFGGILDRHGHKVAGAVARGVVKAIPVLGGVVDEIFRLEVEHEQNARIDQLHQDLELQRAFQRRQEVQDGRLERLQQDLERLLGGFDQRVLAQIPNASPLEIEDGVAEVLRDIPEADRQAIAEAAQAMQGKEGGERMHRGAVLRERIFRSLAGGQRFRHSMVRALHARRTDETLYDPGAFVAGRFEVLEMLGFGGMGTVYRVIDRMLGDPRALKVISPSLLANPELRKRFVLEARVALSLNHPNIVRVMHIDEERDAEGRPGALYLLMELLHGGSLRDLLKTRRRLGWEEVRSLAGQVLEGLAHAHASRVTHLDVKPENIMVDRGGKVRLIDFGLAQALGFDAGLSAAGGAGTPYYMAPEQREGGRRVDHRADLFSTAVVLYEILTGALPFGVVRRVEEVNPGVPPAVHASLMRSMAERPEDRHADAISFKDDLWRAGRTGSTRIFAAPGLAAARTPGPASPGAPAPAPLPAPDRPAAPEAASVPGPASGAASPGPASPAQPAPAFHFPQGLGGGTRILSELASEFADPAELAAQAKLPIRRAPAPVGQQTASIGPRPPEPGRFAAPDAGPGTHARSPSLAPAPVPAPAPVVAPGTDTARIELVPAVSLPPMLVPREGVLQEPTTRLPREVVSARDGARMVLVPTGKFHFSERYEERYLRTYYVDAFPVTNRQYEVFVKEAGKLPPEHWPGRRIPAGRDLHPVVNVTWMDAFLYAQWAGKTLPTEDQWEKAARGTDGREYPWGREFWAHMTNSREGRVGDTTPVDRFEGGRSPWGAYDMAGNVWGWTGSWFDEKQLWRVVRGGSFSDERFGCRTHFRYWMDPGKRAGNVGFRCVKEVE
ncbi:MAG: SUMF1/EgtB/PvdO family nonheme iron enzyme [Planctomycetes bacterium]|nr:SUMF1/EgtB/PvdO family nonheme iron enzyme [Planctomycetota bacterium]